MPDSAAGQRVAAAAASSATSTINDATREPLNAAATERAPEFGLRYSYYALAMLFGVTVLNLTDRSVVNLLLVPIGKDLELKDWQLGLFAGPAFAICYALVQIPIARLADQRRRAPLIALALAFWSSMTMLQAAAVGFISLALARAGVAMGEAGSGPASHSMVSDLFPARLRTRAFAVLMFGAPLGTALGAFIGGWGREWLGWHATLLFVGMPGLVLAVAVWLTVREPTRGYWQARVTTQDASLMDTVRFLLRLPAFRHVLFGYSVWQIVASASSFDAVYLERSFALSPSEIGSWLGAAGLLAAVGYYTGGWLSDRLSLRNPAWSMRLLTIFLLLHLCVSIAYYLADSRAMVIGLMFVHPFLPATLPLVIANVQNLAPAQMRARAGALLLTISTLIGMSIGAPLAGAISDATRASLGQESIRYALLGIVTVGWLWAALHYWLGSRTLARDLEAKERAD